MVGSMMGLLIKKEGGCMAYQGNPGTSRRGRVLTDRMKKQNESPLMLDYGSIEPDYSLKTNTFPVPIPRSDYTVCRHVGGLVLGTTGGEHGGHNSGNGGHRHGIIVPSIKPGDRVLVAWIQNDATVIDVIVPASSI